MSYLGNPINSVAFIPLSVPTTQEEAAALFEYRDGALYWKTNRGYSKVMDKPVGSKTANGYLESKINGKGFKVHRMVFLLHHGWLPEMVDHIDGDRTNNAIENLRAATAQNNKFNQKLYKCNTSGVKGVSWNKEHNKWSAQISYNRRKKFLGRYDTVEEAAEVVDLARRMVHQEFARAA